MDRRAALVPLLAVACVDPVLSPAWPLESFQQIETQRCMAGPAAVDVLLVVDDSASMQDGLDRLAVNLRVWAAVYDGDRSTLPLDYRIAVTSTSVRGPWCDSPSEDGAFVDTSCRARQEGFVVDASAESEAADARAVCTSACALDVVPITPTRVAPDGELRPRPWIERDALVHNLEGGVTPMDALPCLGLVGLDGCRHESPLEAMRLALERTFDPRDPAFGFLRPHAALFILFVTDELDCSVSPEHAGAIADAPVQPSAICWNGGMRCTGPGDPYTDCTETTLDDGGLMRPIEPYLEMLDVIELDKQHASTTDAQRVFVHVLGGVATHGAEPVFAAADDPAIEAAFGIGPGCTHGGDASADVAFPPGRIRVVTDAFAERDVGAFSICEEDYTAALACVPNAPTIQPSCVEGCVADLDPSTPEHEIDCVMTELVATSDTPRPVPPCLDPVPGASSDDPDAWRLEIPEGSDVCVRWRTGDELGDHCASRGYVVEYDVRYAEPRTEASCVTATCFASTRPAVDCPNLP